MGHPIRYLEGMYGPPAELLAVQQRSEADDEQCGGARRAAGLCSAGNHRVSPADDPESDSADAGHCRGRAGRHHARRRFFQRQRIPQDPSLLRSGPDAEWFLQRTVPGRAGAGAVVV